MIYVVCLKWGLKYETEYVNRLALMVKKNLTLPYKFICITEQVQDFSQGIEVLFLPDLGLEGWWYKLIIFKKNFLNLTSQDKILFLDLDIVILNNLDKLVNYSEQFCISCDDTEEHYNSSVMCFNANQYTFIWDAFWIQKDQIMTKMHGDQDWIEHVFGNAIIYPKTLIKSFKVDLDAKTKYSFGYFGRFLRKKFPSLLPQGCVSKPKDAIIVLFHGKPDPVDVMTGPYDKYKAAYWIKEVYDNK